MWTTVKIIFFAILTLIIITGIITIVKGKGKFKKIIGILLIVASLFTGIFCPINIDIYYNVNVATLSQAVDVIEAKVKENTVNDFESSLTYYFSCENLSGYISYIGDLEQEYMDAQLKRDLQSDSCRLVKTDENFNCIIKNGEFFRVELFKKPFFVSGNVWIYKDDAIIEINIENVFLGDEIDLLEIANSIEKI